MKIAYTKWDPGAAALLDIRRANQICTDYAAQGYDLTLRQLYYQFVARGWIPNTQLSYNRLGSVLNKGRMAGLVDWNHIVDRTRNLRANSHWDEPGDIIDSAAESFQLDKWEGQPRRVEVWVEKDALAGIIARVAQEHDVAWFACRGYVSQSELWAAAQRHGRHVRNGQGVTVLHLGDHDPSGIDMTRDIRDRLEQFMYRDWLNEKMPGWTKTTIGEVRDAMRSNIMVGNPIEVERIALNFDQVEQYNPPPNPTKLTDSRATGYIDQHGHESWELDALEPTVLADLVRDHIRQIWDPDVFDDMRGREQEHRRLLRTAARRWDEVVELLDGEPDSDEE